MRFHHSTRRGRHHSAPGSSGGGHHAGSSRWSQLGHCRETNIYFNRRLPVEYPAAQLLIMTDGEEEEEGGEEEKGNRVENNNKTTVFENDMATISNGLAKLTPSGVQNGRLARSRLTNSKKHQQSATGGERAPPPTQATAVAAAGKGDRQERDQEQGQERERDAEATIDAESLREKLIAQVQKHPFWSNKAAKRMQIRSVERRNVFIYELESYCERRDLEWHFEPYRGGLSGGGGGGCGAISALGRPPYRTGQPITPLAVSCPRPASPADSQAGCSGTGGGGGTASNASSQLWWNAVSGGGVSGGDTNQSPSAGRSASQAAAAVAQSSSRRSGILCEPISARLEHLIPSPEFVWSIDSSRLASVGGAGSSLQSAGGRRPLASSSGPCCVASELPNSSFVKRCHGCQGRGKLKCNSCHGVGYEVCLSCSGRGSSRSYSSALSGGAGSRSASYGRSSDRHRSGSSGADRDDPSSSSSFYNTSEGNSRNSRYANGADTSGGSLSAGSLFAESCAHCHGAGQKRCWVCAGKAYNNCPGCAGAGQLRCYLRLTISWLSHCDDVILNNSDQIIPKERLRLCSGLLLVDQIEDRLRPLNLNSAACQIRTSHHHHHHQRRHHQAASGTAAAAAATEAATVTGGSSGSSRRRCCRPDEAERLRAASRHLLDKHRLAYRGEKFLKQRHKVTQIECHLVSYEWKQRQGQFVIYGDERKVYIGKYPFKSFCNLI